MIWGVTLYSGDLQKTARNIISAYGYTLIANKLQELSAIINTLVLMKCLMLIRIQRNNGSERKEAFTAKASGGANFRNSCETGTKLG